MKRTTPLKRTGRLRARSPKRAAQMRTYIPAMLAFLAEHPRCEYPEGCGRPSVVLHHARGRQGARLLDETYWRAACHQHNQMAEDDTGESLRVGWLIPVEGAA